VVLRQEVRRNVFDRGCDGNECTLDRIPDERIGFEGFQIALIGPRLDEADVLARRSDGERNLAVAVRKR